MDILKINLLVDEPIVTETLNRIGIINRLKKIVYPSCYLINMDSEWYLIHFKQLFTLKNKNSYDNMSKLDIERRNAIAYCFKKWELIDVEDELIQPHNVKIDVIPYSEKLNWYVKHKINLNLLKQSD